MPIGSGSLSVHDYQRLGGLGAAHSLMPRLAGWTFTIMTPIVERPILYSANTWLAYMISEHFYGRLHYVWCTTFFKACEASLDCAVPPSSSPAEIYRELYEAVKRGDKHSSKIAANRAGLLNGAHVKRKAGEISDGAIGEIVSVLDQAGIGDFRPLIYVIPFVLVTDDLESVPVGSRAHPLSIEYVIRKLPRGAFDVIEIQRI